jgi:hypothetical protein
MMQMTCCVNANTTVGAFLVLHQWTMVIRTHAGYSCTLYTIPAQLLLCSIVCARMLQ